MKIVFDTNVIVNHWLLRGPSFEMFQKSLELTNDRLVIPQIVILEAKNKYKEYLSQRTENVIKSSNEIRLMLAPSIKFDSPKFDLKSLCEKYNEHLDIRLRELKATIIDHSNIPHDKIIARDLKRQSPFRRSGKGYRDTLLWEVVLNRVVGASERTVLITSDLEDFGYNKKPVLNPHLIDDLKSKGLPENSVQIIERIETFNDQYVKPKLQSLIDIREKLAAGENYPLSISAWFKKNLDRIKEKLTPQVGSLITNDILRGYDIDEPIAIEDIEMPEIYEIDNVFNFDSNRILIETSFTTDVIIDFFIFKMDYYAMQEDLPIEILEWDWNKHYAWAMVTLRVPMSLSLTFDARDKHVEDFEVNFIEYFGRCRNCGEPITHDAAETCPKCNKNLS